jgi:hypothetical protein
VQDHGAGIEAQEDVFCAALDASHGLTLDFRFEAARDGPAQAAISNRDGDDAPIEQGRGNAPPRRFYFRQFGQSPTPT